MTLVRSTLLGLATLVLAGLAAGSATGLATGPAGAGILAGPLPERAASPLVFVDVPVDEMTPGMRVAYIRGIQEELAAHGYKPGPADGIIGPRTTRAIRKYQRDAGLPVTGVATRELLDHMKFVLPKVYARPEPKPSGLVYDVQVKLRDLGYYDGPRDGLTGPRTREAARAFRYDSGLLVNGIIDEALLAALTQAEGQPATEETFSEPEAADWPPEPAESRAEPAEQAPFIAAPPPPAE